jgi:hypothetical protein
MHITAPASIALKSLKFWAIPAISRMGGDESESGHGAISEAHCIGVGATGFCAGQMIYAVAMTPSIAAHGCSAAHSMGTASACNGS